MTPRAALRVLDLKPSLSLTQSIIKKAFIKQTLQCHPDLHPTDPHANDKFRTLSDALRVALMAVRHQSPSHGKSPKRKAHANESANGTKSNVDSSSDDDERVESEEVEEHNDMWSDPQHTLEALRNAMLSYRLHHEVHNKNSANTNGRMEANYHPHKAHTTKNYKVNKGSSSEKAQNRTNERTSCTHSKEESKEKEHTVEETNVHNHYNNTENWNESEFEAEHEGNSFYAPSLEEITRVCRSESQAMYRIRTFCNELPSVLSGNISHPLFEAVAFYHAHHVQTTAECVMRFSRHLPVMVRRVVKNRKRYIHSAFNPRTRGINTGTRPLEQKIEDMTMKPLVLMGALIFDVPVEAQPPLSSPSPESTMAASFAHSNERTFSKGNSHSYSINSTCGVNSIDEIHITPSLKCIIEPSLSVGDVVERLSIWEAASFERLKVELAIVDANSLLTNMLGLAERNKLTVQPHLEHDNQAVTQVLVTLQKLACDMCLSFDEQEDAKVHLTNTHDSELAALMIAHSFTSGHNLTTESINASKSTSPESSSSSLLQQIEKLLLPTHLSETSTSRLIAICRKLVSLASETIAYNITLTWSKDSDELLSVDKEKSSVNQEKKEDERVNDSNSHTTDTVHVENTNNNHYEKEKNDNTSNKKHSESKSYKCNEEYLVQRNPYSSTVEMIEFTISVKLTGQLRDLLIRLCKAFHCVIAQTHKTRSLLAEVVELREKVIAEEFIARTTEISDEERSNHVNAAVEDANKNVEEQCSEHDAANLYIGHCSYMSNATSISSTNNGESKYRYRPPIHCFPRLFNFDVDVEHTFWQYLYEIREYVAKHASQTGYFNVFYNCLPYPITDNTNGSKAEFNSKGNKTSQQSSHVVRVPPIPPLHNLTREQCSNAHFNNNKNGFGSSTDSTLYSRQVCGWVSDDGEGGSNVILMPSALENAEVFRDWLDEVMEQGTLLRTAQNILRDAHIDYIKRAPELPLLHFLSFINLFVKATAVRALIEHHAPHSHTRNVGGSGTSIDKHYNEVGLTIVVDTYCDVCDGGLLHIPWHVDPSILLVLLGQFEQTRELDA